MKNIFKIHPLFYLTAFICFITGLFKDFIIFMSIIIIHELGHIIISCIFKWKIDRVILLPFGGITIFNEVIDKPLYQDLLIALSGPLFQVIVFSLFNNPQVILYSKIILYFNLLPIYPLDGSKIVNVFFNKFFSYKFSHKLSLFLSYLAFFILLYLIFKYNLILIIVLLFIFIEIIKETFKHKYYFNKFLLERYLYNYSFKNRKIISKLDKMKKQTKHIFKIENKYYTERDFMRKTFDK